MKQKPPSFAQPVEVPRVPTHLNGVPLREMTTPARMQALITALAVIIARECSEQDMLQSGTKSQVRG